MKIYKLAKKLANFVWDFDPYHAMDIYETFGECMTETYIGLCNKADRKGIIKWLESIIDEDYEVSYARELIREVKAI